MHNCPYCGSKIFLGGVRDGSDRYCNQTCHQAGVLTKISRQVPDEVIRQRIDEIHRGPCPRCQRQGMVDVHTAHFIWSAVILTRWSSKPRISCASCGTKAKALASLSSLFLGWWGLPWGIILTPVQIGKNVYGMIFRPTSLTPSPRLEQTVRFAIAQEIQRNAAKPPPLSNPPA